MKALKSAGAVAGVLAGAVPPVATDAALAAAGGFPPLDEAKSFTTALLLLATVYPLALIALALPTARAGGRLYVTKERKQQTPRA